MVVAQVEMPDDVMQHLFTLPFWKRLLWMFLRWFHIPSLFIFGALLLGGTLISCPLKTLWRALVAAFSTSRVETKAANEAAAVFQQLAALTVGAGLLGFIVPVIIALFNLSDPTAIGPAISAALFTPLYSGLLGAIVFQSMASDIEARSWPRDTTQAVAYRRST